MLMAFAAIPLLLMVGVAVDLTRLYALRSRLVTATDAAALAGARAIADPTRDAQIRAWFWANFTRRSATVTEGFLRATVTDIRVLTDPADSNVVRVQTTATLPTTFMRLGELVGMGNVALMTAKADQAARRQERGMELALVLDVTGSMSDSPGSGQPSKIASLRNAATDLINIMFGSRATVPNLWVSIVPYTTTVNIGRGRTGFLAPGSYDPGQFLPTVWRGCVEARMGGQDMTDTPPAQAPFQPFRWRSTLNQYSPYPGDNDWSTSGTNVPNEANPESPKSDSQQHSLGNSERGPNLSCERALTPLIQSKATLLSEIAALRAGPDRGGTVTNQGLQWGWNNLSPRWRGLWGTANLPLDYNTPNMDKVLILMTDGVNDLADSTAGAPGACTVTACTKPPGGARAYVATTDSDYTSYGRLAENRLGLTRVSSANAITEFNRRTGVLCASIKAAGITVYTITFALNNTTTQNLFRTCASKPEYYFNSPDATALRGAFTEIGQQLSNLRLVR
ncbi:pilus assembly protein TadG-related protein [Roseomonas sp. BN140053]|uniref:pilus assembly protein TadG-related protein n=1 Tax=Roseomonas sp. BN140053 TaxID=3391898 RepID=UPI0039E8D1F1